MIETYCKSTKRHRHVNRLSIRDELGCYEGNTMYIEDCSNSIKNVRKLSLDFEGPNN